jgi:WD40 repeat protein
VEQHTEILERRDDAALQHEVLEDAEETHSPKRYSRRIFAIGLSLLGGVGLVTGGTLAWKFLLQESQTPPTKRTPPATKPGTTLYTYHGHEGEPMQALAWSNDSQRIASAGVNVQIWDAKTGKLDRVYRNDPENPSARTRMAWSPDNRHIAVAVWNVNSNTAIHVWDVNTERVVHTYVYDQAQSYEVKALAWSPHGTSIASTDGNSIQVWNGLTGDQIASYTGHTTSINSLTWSPDGKWIASCDGSYYADTPVGGTVHVWEVPTGQMRLIYHGHTDSVTAVAWSPNGQLIASAGGTYYRRASTPNQNTVQIWKPTMDTPLLIYSGHKGPVQAVAWSPTSAFVVSGSSNNGVQNTNALVQVWNATTGQTFLSYRGHNFQPTDQVSAVAWSPNGEYIASAGGYATTVQVWKAI